MSSGAFLPVPPLSERRGDIPDLMEYLLTTRPLGPARYHITPEALVRYEWAGNVRELANVLERAQILAEDRCITIDDLPENLVGFHALPADESAPSTSLHQT